MLISVSDISEVVVELNKKLSCRRSAAQRSVSSKILLRTKLRHFLIKEYLTHPSDNLTPWSFRSEPLRPQNEMTFCQLPNRIRGFTTMRYIIRLFTYLLTYFHLHQILQRHVNPVTWKLSDETVENFPFKGHFPLKKPQNWRVSNRHLTTTSLQPR